MSDTVVLKLGGSILTEKQSAGVIHHHRLSVIAETIARHRNLPLIIVHGAGSCGHPEAHRYTIQNGVTDDNAIGVGETHRAVAGLNAIVVRALMNAGLDAIGIHPLCGSLAENGRLVSFETDQLTEMAALGIIPVVHGDVVMDRRRGACIISGDQLVLHIAHAVNADRVGLATDVPGVIADGTVVPAITRNSIKTLDPGDSENTDVTGGMRGKVMELLALADYGIPSSIFHIDRLADFLRGEPHGGTEIRKVHP